MIETARIHDFRPDVAVLRIPERIDRPTAHQIERQVDFRIRRGSNLIAFDMSHVEDIDSLALATLVTSVDRSRERGGNVALATGERTLGLGGQQRSGRSNTREARAIERGILRRRGSRE